MNRFSHGDATSVGRFRRVSEDRHLVVPPVAVPTAGGGGVDA